jgi:hypothetical protein
MNVPRESVSIALFNLLKNNQQLSTLCKTITRAPRIWTTVNDVEKPFLTLFKGGPATEHFDQPQDRRIALTKYIIHYNLWLYVVADPSSQIVAETPVNNIADALDAAMQTDAQKTAYGERQTLGGLVSNCWIDGGNEWGREFEDTNLTVFWRISVETGI